MKNGKRVLLAMEESINTSSLLGSAQLAVLKYMRAVREGNAEDISRYLSLANSYETVLRLALKNQSDIDVLHKAIWK